MNPLFVAEVSSNHNCDLERCLQFIDIAAQIGCDAVKFQYFKIKELFAPEVLAKSEKHRSRKRWELPQNFLRPISERCRKNNILFGCTPFFLEGVKELKQYVDFFKIASYELLWDDLILECATTEKPLVLSTGMASLDEVEHAVNIVIGAWEKEGGKENSYNLSNNINNSSSNSSLIDIDSKLTLLHCISGYPTPIHECNLSAITTLKNKISKLKLKFKTNCGWSDHTVEPAVIYRAVHKWDCSMVEFHLDIDGTGDEYSLGHCWLPNQIQLVIETVKKSFLADGDGKKEPMPSELSDRLWRADPSDGLRPFKEIRKIF